MFNDFRNWRFQMPVISGSTLTVRDNSESILIIPTWALEEVLTFCSFYVLLMCFSENYSMYTKRNFGFVLYKVGHIHSSLSALYLC